jgi:hypothetical protein
VLVQLEQEQLERDQWVPEQVALVALEQEQQVLETEQLELQDLVQLEQEQWVLEQVALVAMEQEHQDQEQLVLQDLVQLVRQDLVQPEHLDLEQLELEQDNNFNIPIKKPQLSSLGLFYF